MLSRFRRDCKGTSALEFALAAPMLALVLLGITDGFSAVAEVSSMRGAVKNGANYVIKGGTDLDATKQAVSSAWTHKPDSAQINASYACSCAGASNACTTLCPDGTSVPHKSMTISASTYVDAPFWVPTDPWTITNSQVVRVR